MAVYGDDCEQLVTPAMIDAAFGYKNHPTLSEVVEKNEAVMLSSQDSGLWMSMSPGSISSSLNSPQEKKKKTTNLFQLASEISVSPTISLPPVRSALKRPPQRKQEEVAEKSLTCDSRLSKGSSNGQLNSNDNVTFQNVQKTKPIFKIPKKKTKAEEKENIKTNKVHPKPFTSKNDKLKKPQIGQKEKTCKVGDDLGNSKASVLKESVNIMKEPEFSTSNNETKISADKNIINSSDDKQSNKFEIDMVSFEEYDETDYLVNCAKQTESAKTHPKKKIRRSTKKGKAPRSDQQTIKTPAKETKKTGAKRGRKRRRSAGIQDVRKSDSEEGKTQKEPVLKGAHELPATTNFPVWVECTLCFKWRELTDIFDPSIVEVNWHCELNSDPDHNECSKPEATERLSAITMIETKYTLGSVVWVKGAASTLWPAMIDDDPNVDLYYWLDSEDNDNTVTQYHVTFFGKPVTRLWVGRGDVMPFNSHEPLHVLKSKKLSARNYKWLLESLNDAERACQMELNERIKTFGFATRWGALPPKYKNSNLYYE